MPPIINAQEISKAFGAAPLFRNLSFTVSEGDRIGLIGPNGSGKSTLLQILSGAMEPDSGTVAIRRQTRLACVQQRSQFPPEATVRSVVARALERAAIPEDEREGRLSTWLGRVGFEDFSLPADSLSGGWQKRLAIAEALVQSPDVLLLDEPTNHLDLAGIDWLEGLLQTAQLACVVVSHDRYFLENVTSVTTELNHAYPEGLLRVEGNYSVFLEKKAEFLHAQARQQQSLENRVRQEIAWLRRGPKARTSKAKARIDKAHELIAELGETTSRARTSTAEIDFTSTDRKTKRLIELQQVGCEVAGRELFRNLDLVITAGKRIGLVGPNGSGKTTLLRLLRGELKPSSGEITKAEFLRVVYFDQNRPLDSEVSLRRALAPDSDSVVYQERVIHVAGWASRFLFTGEQLDQPVGRLSGGERARVLIAQLMLQPADVLLLDEPTNDLDIPTLELLEESLLEFNGALVLVTHDRYLLDRVCDVVLGLDGRGAAEIFADYSQYETWQAQQEKDAKAHDQAKAPEGPARAESASSAKKKLSYLEAREFATIEQRITETEEILRQRQSAAEDPAIASDATRLLAAHAELEQAQKEVDDLYARWSELEDKMR